ncbi:hypothetical protein QUA40_23440 [Microcoleus sp. Pol11C3]
MKLLRFLSPSSVGVIAITKKFAKYHMISATYSTTLSGDRSL